MSDLTDFFPSGGSSGGGGLLTGTTTYRALIIGGGGNGVYGSTYGAGGSGAGAFFDTTLSFLNDTTYNVEAAAGGGTSSFETAFGKFYAPTGGSGVRNGNGGGGAAGGGAGGANTNWRMGGMPNMYNLRGEYLGNGNTYQVQSSTVDWYYHSFDFMKNQGLQTFGFPGGTTNSGYQGGGGGGMGSAGTGQTSNGAGGNGRTSDIITTTTAASASVGQVDGINVWFGSGGYGGTLASINTSKLGRGPGTGGGGQGSNNAAGVSNGDSGCVILKVPSSTDFTQTGASAYTDQGMTVIIWTGVGTFQINS